MIELANYRELLFIIGLIVVIIAFLILFLKSRSPKQQQTSNLPFDITLLYTALGGKDNITSAKAVQSKLSIALLDTSVVDVGSIQDLGATGVVMKRDEVIIIFGKISSLVAKEINC